MKRSLFQLLRNHLPRMFSLIKNERVRVSKTSTVVVLTTNHAARTCASFCCECSDMCTAGNRPWSSEFFLRMLGNVHSGQPTVISRVSSSREKWMLGYVLVIQPTVILRVSSTWMLGYVLVRQPTVILRRKKWMLGYVPSAFFIKKL